MVLTTHALVGAGLAQLFPGSPALAFTAGFLSHFVLDTVPHWDYSLASSRKDVANPLNNDIVVGRTFVADLLKIVADALLGTVLAVLFFHNGTFISLCTLMAGAMGGMLPDPLQFAYMKLRVEPLVSLQRFHVWMHAKTNFNDAPAAGIAFQAAIIVATVLVFMRL